MKVDGFVEFSGRPRCCVAPANSSAAEGLRRTIDGPMRANPSLSQSAALPPVGISHPGRIAGNWGTDDHGN